MDNVESFGQLLYSKLVIDTQNTITDIDPLQIRPTIPSSLTCTQLLSANIADYRNSRRYDGMKAYRYACYLRAQELGLNLSFTEISSMASILWGRHESHDIKQVYINVGEEATHIHEFHNGQFPDHKCEECPNHNNG
ncbi:hypothetical protein RclHR1_00030008 [Rhizophagus clarus]|uniref:HMG box domain-containing protein n=1 Tax=Rhizophagus clarus TaxID=94130 RepID=A0A2Z6RL73_9GLOM|nr:hypothetical protein RclHR1_00030008 [Rhizophagus clarus]GES92304.1 hypothetical protein GLOIN_2v1786750 [Rhizophagus clarus]